MPVFLLGCATHPNSPTSTASSGAKGPRLTRSPSLRPSLSGHFEAVSGPEDTRFLTATTRVEGDSFHIEVIAGHRNGHGAAPDGEGHGAIGTDGVATFDYEDSFFCRGRGTFRCTEQGYRLTIAILEWSDPPPRYSYGTFTLYRK